MTDLRMVIITRALKELGEYIGKRFDDLKDALPQPHQQDNSDIVAAIQALEAKLNIKPIVSVTPPDLTPILDAIQNIKIPEPKQPESVKADIKALTKAVQSLELSTTVEAPDLSPILKAIKAIKLEQKDVDLSPVINAIENIKLPQPPTTLKLDDMQLRALTAGGGGARDMTARRVTVKNVAMASTAEQYQYSFPANTVSWKLKLRDQGTLLYYAFTSGKLPNSGSGTDYMTAPQNFIESGVGIDWSGKTIYLGAEANDMQAEIISFQLQ